MQVNISFDTEREKIENLKKLVSAVQELISHREGKPINPIQSQISKPIAQQIPRGIEKPITQQSSAKAKTSGGCRVIPFEDMTDQMAKIFSGKRY
jgi:hypothetical protein